MLGRKVVSVTQGISKFDLEMCTNVTPLVTVFIPVFLLDFPGVPVRPWVSDPSAFPAPSSGFRVLLASESWNRILPFSVSLLILSEHVARFCKLLKNLL